MNTITFILSSLIIILLPGTGVLYTIATALSHGKKAGLLAALACTAGIIPHLCLSISLSSCLLNMGSSIFYVIRIMGVCYLFYLGISMIISQCKKKAPDSAMHTEAFQTDHILLKGILINLLNPKLTLFFFSFLPQYVSSDRSHYVLNSLIAGLAFMVITLLVFAGYGLLASYARRFLTRSRRLSGNLQIGCGVLFLFFAIRLLC